MSEEAPLSVRQNRMYIKTLCLKFQLVFFSSHRTRFYFSHFLTVSYNYAASRKATQHLFGRQPHIENSCSTSITKESELWYWKPTLCRPATRPIS